MTLTANPSMHTDPDAGFRALSTAVNALFKRLRRKYSRTEIQYALIWETTKKGWPHAHILLRGPYMAQPVISRAWAELTGAPIVDIRKVTSEGQAAKYVTKYLTKALTAPANMKRYRSSRQYAARDPKQKLADYLGPLEWLHSCQTLLALKLDLVAHFYRIEDISPDFILAYRAEPP